MPKQKAWLHIASKVVAIFGQFAVAIRLAYGVPSQITAVLLRICAELCDNLRLYPRHLHQQQINEARVVQGHFLNAAEIKKEIELEIGHFLFDIVGFSKLLIDEQRDYLHTLNEVIKRTDSFRAADAADKLTRLPTGDGMALVFATTPDAPVSCAIEISNALRSHPELRVRIGIHSGPVSGTTDVNDRSNVAGAGINLAQRVMDCGDAGTFFCPSVWRTTLNRVVSGVPICTTWANSK